MIHLLWEIAWCATVLAVSLTCVAVYWMTEALSRLADTNDE